MMTENERLLKHAEEEDIIELMRHIGYHGGLTNIDACRIAARRAAEALTKLQADLEAFYRVSEALIARKK